MRVRSLILALSRTLFNTDLSLLDFPTLKSIRGLGVSDAPIYANALAHRFTYTNTYFHQQPVLDVSNPPTDELGKFDFIICSEVLEHVNAPVEAAISGILSLLKPSGFALITVPYGLDPATVEHFANLTDCVLAKIGGKTVLVGRDENEQHRVFPNLVFHGGDGATLERRIFSEDALKTLLQEQGFANVQIEAGGSEEFGVVYDTPCSLPVIASPRPLPVLPPQAKEFVDAFVCVRQTLREISESRWFRLGRLLGLGPKIERDS